MQKKYCGSMIVKRIEENRPPEWIFCYPNTERSGFARYGSCGKIHGTERFCEEWLSEKNRRTKRFARHGFAKYFAVYIVCSAGYAAFGVVGERNG